MQIQTALPLAFSHVGQRVTNQDTLYPAVGTASEQSGLFIVCDGMGGLDKGEIASRLLCEAVFRYASAMDYPIFDHVHLKTALDQAYSSYYDYLRAHPLVSRMGSTLAFLQIHERGVTVAHIGDSRVYQIRNREIIFRTQDHKQVADMVTNGIITAEQARTHPWRNRLSRAVTVSSTDKEGQTSPPCPDISMLQDVQPGDYFFMCTDGVLETVDDQLLINLLAGNEPDQVKIQVILDRCDNQTKDNYSGYLIGIQHVIQTKSASTVALS
jgi:protein phosphatase